MDTSVWIDFLAGRRISEVERMFSLLEDERTIVYTGFILLELLQGCADDRGANAIESHFEPFIEIFPQRSTYRLAAKIFRDCRRCGYTIRSSADCLLL
ncbi:MAG: PIN domain nuclease [Chthoniobacterales bacterium]